MGGRRCFITSGAFGHGLLCRLPPLVQQNLRRPHCSTLVMNSTCLERQGTLAVDSLDSGKPSKCPKFYTNRILGEQNLRQKVRKFRHNLNRDKITYLIKYALTVQFSIAQEKLPWVK